jgi:hypothetical protein
VENYVVQFLYKDGKPHPYGRRIKYPKGGKCCCFVASPRCGLESVMLMMDLLLQRIVIYKGRRGRLMLMGTDGRMMFTVFRTIMITVALTLVVFESAQRSISWSFVEHALCSGANRRDFLSVRVVCLCRVCLRSLVALVVEFTCPAS